MSKEPRMRSTETLALKAKRWKQALSDSRTGPLVIAEEICSVADSWDNYRAEAKGLSATTWLKQHFGQHVGYFRRRFNAVQRLGEASRRRVDHEAAVWVADNVPADKLEQVKMELLRMYKQRNNNPPSKNVVERHVRKMLGKQASSKPICQRCRELERVLREHGIEV